MSGTAPTVLIIDDEVQIRRFLQSGFGAAGFSVREAKTAGEGIGSVMLRLPDLIILDLGLPDMDGAEVLQRCRSWSDVPVIILSGRASENEKVRLLDLGADDYVVKPFGMAELVARGRAAMRRRQHTMSGEIVLKLGHVTLDFATRSVSVEGRRILLTHKEYRLFEVLAQHAGNVLTHQHLLKEVWGTLHLNDMHYLRIMIRNLRKKIEADPTRPRIILTELGVGYRLGIDDEGEEQTESSSCPHRVPAEN
jgi:two-component system, OmpR family, KDP operon response regulator KdpE